MSCSDHMMSLQGNDRVIDKILKLISGEVGLETITTDPDLAPLRAVFESGQSSPC